MLIPTPTRILVAIEPVDFRKQIDGLASVCERQLGADPLDGTMFVFTNRRKNAMKALIWTVGGFSMVYKKLEQGRFRWPAAGDVNKTTLSPAELAALVEGWDLSGAKRLKRWNPKKTMRDTTEDVD